MSLIKEYISLLKAACNNTKTTWEKWKIEGLKKYKKDYIKNMTIVLNIKQ